MTDLLWIAIAVELHRELPTDLANKLFAAIQERFNSLSDERVATIQERFSK